MNKKTKSSVALPTADAWRSLSGTYSEGSLFRKSGNGRA